MSIWSKKGKAIHYPGSMEVEKYVYTPGIHGLEFAKSLIEGKILGMKCNDTILVPPKTYCPDGSMGTLVEVEDEWVVETYTVIYSDMEGRKLDKPVVIGLVRPLTGEGGIIHYIKIDPDKIEPGIIVKPVFRPKEQRRGVITDIAFFEPA